MSAFITKLMTQADGEKLYAKIGRFLGSPEVRRECGGYALNDGPDYMWIVALDKRALTSIGFVSLSRGKQSAVMHQAYVDPDRRSQGVYRELLRQALAYADHEGLAMATTQQSEAAAALAKHGFKETGRRGSWIKLERKAKK